MKREARVCVECGRPAVFVTAKNRKRRARKDHDLCEKCYRSDRDRNRPLGTRR